MADLLETAAQGRENENEDSKDVKKIVKTRKCYLNGVRMFAERRRGD